MRCDSKALGIAFNRIIEKLRADKEEMLQDLVESMESSKTPAKNSLKKLQTRNPIFDEGPTDDRIVMFKEGVKWAIQDLRKNNGCGGWPIGAGYVFSDTEKKGTA